MKKFILQYLCVFLLAASVVELIDGIRLYRYGDRLPSYILGEEVYNSIRSSKTSRRVKRLIAGDSTGHQLYPSWKDYGSVALSVACNQAVTMAGHYFLIEDFLQTNENQLPEEVVLVINPETFGNNVDRFAFNYFLKPFGYVEYIHRFTPTLRRRIRQIPFYMLAYLPSYKLSNYSPSYEMTNEEFAFISPVSKEYLCKIAELTQRYGVKLRLVSSPVPNWRYDWFMTSIQTARDSGELSGLESVMMEYVTTIIPHDDADFQDHVHLHNHLISEDYLNLVTN